MFLTAARLACPLSDLEPYVAELAVVRALAETPLNFRESITVISGENGVGKSTLVEALAAALRISPSGGSRHSTFGSAASISSLHKQLIVTRRENPEDAFFLRGETMSDMAGYYETLVQPARSVPMNDLLHMSHGQSIMALIQRRFGAGGLFLLDEPEAGLSMLRQLELLGRLHHLARAGSQIIVATHSPVLMAIPGAQLLEVSENGIMPRSFEECESVQAAREFVADPHGTASFLIREQ